MVQKNNKYPCYNRSLKNIESEEWEDIPGFDGYYMVSNFGRIKRMKREQLNSKGIVRIFKEQIIAPRIGLGPNHYKKDFTYHLFAHFSLEGNKYHLPIRRLVYYCFIVPFDLKDKTVTIICNNGNGLDVGPLNLKLTSLSEASLRVMQLKRRLPEFKNVDHKKASQASIQVTSRQISQYDHSGNKIKTYPSIMEASRQLNIGYSSISNTAHEREPTAGGYYWKFGNASYFNVKGFLEKRSIGFKEKKGTKVTQYSLTGHRIAQFLTLTDGAKSIGKDYTGISAAIRGVITCAYGYIWKRGWGKAKINVKKITSRQGKQHLTV